MAIMSRRNWGESIAFLARARVSLWIDLLLVVGLLGLGVGLLSVGREWTGAMQPAVTIDLSPWALPKYTFYSLSRGLVAYGLSLVFTLIYGYWAAKDKAAEKLLVPLLDILQSIPVLGFMPGLVLGLVSLFPRSNMGLELAAVLMIFTGQAWNMTFSYYHSLRAVPNDLKEVARVYRFSWFRRLVRVELPFSTLGLVWNSMMSMAGGWFFLMINEAFRLGDRDFRLPGLGSYMSAAAEQHRGWAQLYAVIAMTLMIVLLDQLLWRPIIVWAQKFRIEESGGTAAMNSWFLDFLRRSRIASLINTAFRRLAGVGQKASSAAGKTLPGAAGEGLEEAASQSADRSLAARVLSTCFLALFIALLLLGVYKLIDLLRQVPPSAWGNCFMAGGATLLRVLVSTALGTLWALPLGILIGLSPRLSRVLQPVVQVVASFPAPMLFPAIIVLLRFAGITLNYGAVLLMLLGTQWYILFNVVAGAMAIPADLREVAQSYNFTRLRRFKELYLPAVFPYLVTGWVTAAGGAWNTSIVAEYYSFSTDAAPLQAYGLGALVSLAAYHKQFPLLAAAIIVMSAIVVTFNLTVWRQLYHLAETRFSLNK